MSKKSRIKEDDLEGNGGGKVLSQRVPPQVVLLKAISILAACNILRMEKNILLVKKKVNLKRIVFPLISMSFNNSLPHTVIEKSFTGVYCTVFCHRAVFYNLLQKNYFFTNYLWLATTRRKIKIF